MFASGRSPVTLSRQSREAKAFASEPVVANLDNNGYAGVTAYEIPDTANARIRWHTGRAGQTYQPGNAYLLWTR